MPIEYSSGEKKDMEASFGMNYGISHFLS